MRASVRKLDAQGAGCPQSAHVRREVHIGVKGAARPDRGAAPRKSRSPVKGAARVACPTQGRARTKPNGVAG